MKHFEIEQKYRVKNPLKIRSLLRRLGGRKRHSGNESNELYDFKRRLRAKRSILRLRRWGSRSFLTFKGPRLRSHYKKRLEVETPVDFESARALLKRLGFRVVARYQKKREEFEFGSVLVTLDHLSRIGWFAEIEGKPAQIKATARKLELSNRDCEPRSYLQILFPSWRKGD